MRATGAFFMGCLLIVCTAGAASAEDGVLGAVEDYLDRASNYLDENRIGGKVRFSPYIAQRVIYDDNVYLNDEDEQGTNGEEWDVISDSTVRLGFVLPVNRSYSELYDEVFGRDELTIFEYEARFLEYAHRGALDSINQHFRTDLFGFLEELSLGTEGRRFWFDVGAEYSDVSDPLDLELRDIDALGFEKISEEDELRRRRIDAHAALGYRGNHFDVSAGYEFYWLDFKNDFFQQANQTSHKGFVEAGISPQSWDDKRIYVRGTAQQIQFHEDFLNDGRIFTGVIGFEGTLLSKKLFVVAEGGYLHWCVNDNGLLGDEEEYQGGIGLLRLAYQPWSERNVTFQLEAIRTVEWSVISNFRVDHTVALTVFNQFTEKLEGDVTLAWSHHVPSAGPIRDLYEVGLGIRYHLMERVDLTARYLHRFQIGYREEFLTTVDEDSNVVTLRTDGDFDQNVFSLGIEIEF